jgi:hypothetical protein
VDVFQVVGNEQLIFDFAIPVSDRQREALAVDESAALGTLRKRLQRERLQR